MRRPGKLSPDQVVKIRTEYARCYKSSYQLGREYGLTMGAILSVVQCMVYKTAGGPRTWPGEHEPPRGKVRGHCYDVACSKPIAPAGWAQRMHMCEDCFRINGGKKGRQKEGKTLTLTCRVCRQRFSTYLPPSKARPKTCGPHCGSLLSAGKRSKRPIDLTDERLYELYWGKDMTAPEISALYGEAFTKDSVILWLTAANIPRRRQNWRTKTSCIVDGCDQPILKRWNGKQWYGRLCKTHWNERDSRRQKFFHEEAISQSGQALQMEIRRLTNGLPDAVRLDAESEIMVAALSGDVALPLTRESVKPYIAQVFRANADAWKFLSLSAPTRDGDDAQTWGERLGLV